MATLEELYAKIVSDDAEKRALAEAFATKEGARAFMEQHGCDATPAELIAFLKEKACAAGEVSDGELEGAAGGTVCDLLLSIFGIAIICGFVAASSYFEGTLDMDAEDRTFGMCAFEYDDKS